MENYARKTIITPIIYNADLIIKLYLSAPRQAF
jgi:hypothetical protein